MKWSRLFLRGHREPKRFVNEVDESLLQRLGEQREWLRSQGIQVTPVLRVRDSAAMARGVPRLHDDARAGHCRDSNEQSTWAPESARTSVDLPERALTPVRSIVREDQDGRSTDGADRMADHDPHSEWGATKAS